MAPSPLCLKGGELEHEARGRRLAFGWKACSLRAGLQYLNGGLSVRLLCTVCGVARVIESETNINPITTNPVSREVTEFSLTWWYVFRRRPP